MLGVRQESTRRQLSLSESSSPPKAPPAGVVCPRRSAHLLLRFLELCLFCGLELLNLLCSFAARILDFLSAI